MTTRKLKRVVIKEELYALTKDTFCAIILGQLIYWQERVEDFDVFIKEEKARADNNGIDLPIELQNGWIYKKASDLAAECMLNVSDVTIRRYLQNLINKKYIECRNNPKYKWDKTLQYRVNLSFVISEIKKLGYDGLSGYTSLNIQSENTELQNEGSSKQNEAAIPKITNIDYNIDKEERDKSLSKKEKPLWKTDFAEYQKLVEDARATLKSDDAFRQQMLKFHPNADYDLSIDKSVETFWITEAGWNNKKKSRANSIDMVATLKRNFDRNIVYVRYGQKARFDNYEQTTRKEDKLIINGMEYE